MPSTSDSSHISLVADVGATNARFQLCDGEGLLGQPTVLATPDYATCEALLQAALQALAESEVVSALLAVAGPRDDAGRLRVTNTGLLFDEVTCSAVLGGPVFLVNDFFAMAHGVPHFTQLLQIGGNADAQGVRGLLGPGSGLGMAMVVPVSHGTGWLVIPSEGGNADLAPGSHLEAELWGALLAAHGHVSWETALSGPGLVNLYRAMCGVWGGAAEQLSPADVTERGMNMTDPVCHQTLETFCALLGAAAGNLALTAITRGGVYIGGGIVPRMVDFLATSPLRRRFEERGAMSELARDIPLYVLAEPDAGLVGAMHCLRTMTLTDQ